jgi:hypothetical protein
MTAAEDCIDQLGPSVVVRSALFSMRRLDDLADPDLAALSTDCGRNPSPAFEQAYATSMRRQRRLLWEATVDDPRFAKALCITNDELSRYITTKRAALRGRRARRLDTTLYRYLARAVWRTEPRDMWAGVTLARWAATTELTGQRSRYAIAPDLQPYQYIVQSLADTDRYAGRGSYKLNPSLARDTETNSWRYTVRSFSAIISRQRPFSPGIDALLDALATLDPAPLDTIARHLRALGFHDPQLDELLSVLPDLGLLVGGLAFPRSFSTAWDALIAVPGDLDEDHARAWRGALLSLRRICVRLENAMDSLSLAELRTAQEEARRIPVALAESLGVTAPPLPRTILRCDTSAPFSIAFGADARATFDRSVAEHDHFERHHGVTVAARAAHRKLLLARVDREGGRNASDPTECDGDAISQEAAWRSAGSDERLGRRLTGWSQWLANPQLDPTNRHESDDELTQPPLGGLVLRPCGHGYRIVGSTIELAAAYGRFGQLFYGLGSASRHGFEGHALHDWYQASFAAAAAAAGIEMVEYVGPGEAMPNALARPRFVFPAWDRWGVRSSYRDDQFTVHSCGPRSVALASASGRTRVAIACFAPVNLGYSEPHLETLLLSSFREIATWLTPEMPVDAELFPPNPSPGLALPSGNVVKIRRTVLWGTELKELAAAAPGAARFLLWLDLARKNSWPALVLVSRNGGAALPVVRDSPLAVEALLHGLSDGTRFLTVEEPDDREGLVDQNGEVYAVEYIVPFLRRSHAWSELDADQLGDLGRRCAGRTPANF